MNKIQNYGLRARELLKVALNPIYWLYGRALQLFGIIDFPLPPNSNMRRTSAKSVWGYWYSGLTTSLPIFTHIQAAGLKPHSNLRILDFGCGVGGQIRRMRKYFPNADLVGCDIDPSSIRWLKKNYPSVDFSLSEAGSKLDFTTDSFDVVYSVSTFSHFSEQISKLYMKELSRILKPGGLAVLTIEGEYALSVVAKEWGLNIGVLESQLKQTGCFHITYEWIAKRSKVDYQPISDSVDITTYFDDEYGATIFSDFAFSEMARAEGLNFVSKSVGTCCDRQDIYVFEKSKDDF